MKQNWIVILLLLSAFIVFAPVVNAETGEMKQVFPENDTAGYIPVDVISIDPAINAATPFDMILIADAEGRQNLLVSIDGMNYDTDGRNISQEARIQMKEDLMRIWEKYPVDFIRLPGSAGYPTYGGSVIRIQFADNRTGVKLTDSENKFLERIQILGNYNYRRSHNLTDPESNPATRPTPLPAPLAVIAVGGSAIIAVIRKHLSQCNG